MSENSRVRIDSATLPTVGDADHPDCEVTFALPAGSAASDLWQPPNHRLVPRIGTAVGRSANQLRIGMRRLPRRGQRLPVETQAEGIASPANRDQWPTSPPAPARWCKARARVSGRHASRIRCKEFEIISEPLVDAPQQSASHPLRTLTRWQTILIEHSSNSRDDQGSCSAQASARLSKLWQPGANGCYS